MSTQRAKDDLKKYRHQLRMKSRRLHGDSREPAWAELHRVATWVEQHGLEVDAYGDGEHLQAFEQRVAELLGFPSARFMPSGTMAQQIAVRVWTDLAGNDSETDKNVGMHPTCHLELHEELGYRHLHGLSAVPVGAPDQPIVAADVDGLAEPISVLIVELPARELGGLLPPFDEVVAISEAAQQRGIALHMDGARLWEAAAGYGRSLHEIAQLFDSVYVSFYKGIGALPGSMLLGPEEFVAEAGIWQVRHGGRLYTQLGNWASAAMRLDDQLAKMPGYFERAKEIARSLQGIPGIEISPQVPHVNMFHVAMTGDLQALLHRRDRAAEQNNVWLFGEPQPTDASDTFTFEVAVGDAAMALSNDEIRAAFTTLADVADVAAVAAASVTLGGGPRYLLGDTSADLPTTSLDHQPGGDLSMEPNAQVWHLAQINIGRLNYPVDDPRTAEFMENLDPINALAEASPGFIWRLQDESGNATALRGFDDPTILPNLSVWTSPQALQDYVFKSDHARFLRRRREWFQAMDDLPVLTMWWIPAGHIPTLEEARERVEHLAANGPSEYAFSFRPLFEPPQS